MARAKGWGALGQFSRPQSLWAPMPFHAPASMLYLLAALSELGAGC